MVIKRKPGALKGKIQISKNFNDPLPDNIQDAFSVKKPMSSDPVGAEKSYVSALKDSLRKPKQPVSVEDMNPAKKYKRSR